MEMSSSAELQGLPLSEPSADAWDEFFFWGGKFHGSSEFDAAERDYKLEAAALLKKAHAQLLENDSAWPAAIKEAMKSNLVAWISADNVNKWIQNNTEGAGSALKELWSGGEPAESIRQFSKRFPQEVLKGAGTRLNVISFLCAGVNPLRLPVMRVELFNAGMRLTGYPELPQTDDEAELYSHGLAFLDRMIEEGAKREVALRDRLDAQSVLWSVLKNPLTDLPDGKQRLAWARYRHELKVVWWVNQGDSYRKERDAGYVWAPQHDRAGRALAHHVNVYKLRPDDIILHYADGAIRALGKVGARPKKAPRPGTSAAAGAEDPGYYCRVTYRELAAPIELTEIPAELRTAEAPPFTKQGSVQQAYLYPVSEAFARDLRHRFNERWPEGSPWEKSITSYWLFQANPERYDLAKELKEQSAGDVDNWMVSRFRDEMHEGDPVILWQAGPQAGIYALGELRGAPYERKPADQFFENGDESTGWAVDFTITDILDPPIKKADILGHPVLGALNVIKSPQGTNFRVTAEQWKALLELRDGTLQPPPIPPAKPPGFEAIAAHVRALGLRLSERTLRRFHTAMETRGFIILSGISGTGKTWLAEAYAKAVGAEFLLVPVAPNWTSNEDLLGYFNPLDKEYHHTLFSQFLQRAADEFQSAEKANRIPRKFIVLLDEMNLARVEQYFAKFLSGMEIRSRSRAAAIELWNHEQALLTPNLYFVGTVNIDETTHGFADKVHDRAQLIELAVERDDLADHVGTAAWGSALLEIWDAVADIAPFAYRVVDDIRAYIDHATGQGASWEEALDEQVLQKILPKLNGTDVRLQGALEQVVEWAQEAYPLTAAKAQRMLQAFQQHGFSSYF